LRSAWLLVGVYVVMIFALSSIPLLSPPVKATHADKAAHFAEYFGLGWLLFRALSRTAPGASRGTRFLVAVGLGAVVAAVDEVYQGTVGRERSMTDWLADVTGLLAAATVTAWRDRRRELVSADGSEERRLR
jgi:VanZ family protein